MGTQFLVEYGLKINREGRILPGESIETHIPGGRLQLFLPGCVSMGFRKGNSRYGPLHLWSMSLMGHQVVVMVQCNYGPGHLWATT